MGRSIFSINQCSSPEQRLLRAMRAVAWSVNWSSQSGFLLEEAGLAHAHTYAFATLVKTITQADPEFELLGPDSPFVSKDELNLLASLASAARKTDRERFSDHDDATPVVLRSAIDKCGQALRKAAIVLKPRIALRNARPLAAISSEVPPLRGGNSLRRVQVIAVHQPTPNVRRIVFGGPALKTFKPELPAQWIKLFLPHEEQSKIGRAFTIRDFDASVRHLTIDITLHEQGPMSEWALRAVVGDQLQISDPRGGFRGCTQRSWLLLAGDETAISALAGIVRGVAQEVEVHMFIEVSDRCEVQFMVAHPNVKLRWIFRYSADESPIENLCDVLRHSLLPATKGDAWIAGEAAAVRSIRTLLLRERGFEPGRVQAAEYWKKGEEDHRDIAAG
jgi:NADPH-dependent ferric siderophore reductase